jgi:recombination protein RecA
MAKKSNVTGLSIADLRKMANKKYGLNVAYNLNDENPSEVVDWIPTGSRWLDSIVCRGRVAGIPVGRITELAGLESTGKSYMAAQIAANAQQRGINVVYFDAESAISPDFMANAGCDLEKLIYVQAQTVEMVLETIEMYLGTGEQFLFIWDSVAFTPAIGDKDGDFNPQSTMALKARVLSKGMQKITVPIANTNSTLLVLNQLKTNITRSPSEAMVSPYVTPGGKALMYAYSLRIWLTGRKAKAAFIEDENGYRVGSEVKCKLQKSRFGTQGRIATFKILWGDNVRICDEESWFEAIKSSKYFSTSGAWHSLAMEDGETKKFQGKSWLGMLEDKTFKNRVIQIMNETLISDFKNRKGDASSHYTLDEDENQT